MAEHEGTTRPRLLPGLTISRYVMRELLMRIGVVFGVCVALIFLFGTVELLRRLSGKEELGFGFAVGLAGLQVPALSEKALPFAVLFGAMWCFLRLARSNELVVTRASGLSAWQFLAPALATAFAIGVFAITVYNPVSASFIARFENLEAKHITGRASLTSVSSAGVWLRQVSDGDTDVIYARRTDAEGSTLRDVTFFRYAEQDRFRRRMDARSATLEEGRWVLEDVVITSIDEPPSTVERMEVPTRLTLEQIQDSFAPPETLSFWALPNFIALLEQSGFSAVRHRIHWNALAAQPMLLCAMVLLAAAFSMRSARFARMGQMVLACVLSGFGLYFLSDVSLAIGVSGALPPALAAWIPTITGLSLGAWALFLQEDG